MIAALVLSGAALCRRDASSAGAVLLGLAAAIKGPALLFAPYLVWRRRIVALLLLLAVALSANILPDLVRRPIAGHSMSSPSHFGLLLLPASSWHVLSSARPAPD